MSLLVGPLRLCSRYEERLPLIAGKTLSWKHILGALGVLLVPAAKLVYRGSFLGDLGFVLG